MNELPDEFPESPEEVAVVRVRLQELLSDTGEQLAQILNPEQAEHFFETMPMFRPEAAEDE